METEIDSRWFNPPCTYDEAFSCVHIKMAVLIYYVNGIIIYIFLIQGNATVKNALSKVSPTLVSSLVEEKNLAFTLFFYFLSIKKKRENKLKAKIFLLR